MIDAARGPGVPPGGLDGCERGELHANGSIPRQLPDSHPFLAQLARPGLGRGSENT
jgi:hypothetical protein